MSDLISRQAAIERLKKHRKVFCKNHMEFTILSDEDKARVDEIDNAIATLINLPSAQPELRWIPCDKGEPDEDTECWVTVKTTDALYRGNFTKRYGERRNKGFITSDGFMWWNTALAWMPIYEPEPYREERTEE